MPTPLKPIAAGTWTGWPATDLCYQPWATVGTYGHNAPYASMVEHSRSWEALPQEMAALSVDPGTLEVAQWYPSLMSDSAYANGQTLPWSVAPDHDGLVH